MTSPVDVRTIPSQSIEWYTPPEVFTALGLTFDLDPCSPGAGLSFVPARRHYTADDDGLAQPWTGRVFVNPPYGRETRRWVAKLADHGDGIALVFARTDAAWWQATARRAGLTCLTAGRLRFYPGTTAAPGGSPALGSSLFAFGTAATDALAASGLGLMVRPIPAPTV